MVHVSTAHEVLAVVFQVRATSAPGNPHFTCCCGSGHWTRERGKWSLPGGRLGDDEDLTSSVRRQLAEKVDLRELAHLEQLAVFSDPHRVPDTRTIASTFLGLVPSPAIPELPADTRWHPVNALPPMAFDHGPMVEHARTRLVAKLSYTNIGFALAPREFVISTLRDIYGAALGYQVDATNLQRVLERRQRHHPHRHHGPLRPQRRAAGRTVSIHRRPIPGDRRVRRPTAAGMSRFASWPLLRDNGSLAHERECHSMESGVLAKSGDAEWIGRAPHEELPPRSRPVLPAEDPFYQPPPGFEHARPGTVLRSRDVELAFLG